MRASDPQTQSEWRVLQKTVNAMLCSPQMLQINEPPPPLPSLTYPGPHFSITLPFPPPPTLSSIDGLLCPELWCKCSLLFWFSLTHTSVFASMPPSQQKIQVCILTLNGIFLHFFFNKENIKENVEIEWLHYMVNFLNYIFPKANVFLKASLIDCWL